MDGELLVAFLNYHWTSKYGVLVDPAPNGTQHRTAPMPWLGCTSVILAFCLCSGLVEPVHQRLNTRVWGLSGWSRINKRWKVVLGLDDVPFQGLGFWAGGCGRQDPQEGGRWCEQLGFQDSGHRASAKG